MNDIPNFEGLLPLKMLLHDIKVVNEKIIREFARRSEQKYENTVRLLTYNNQICYMSNINAAFQPFRCPNWDTSSNTTFNSERRLFTCSERLKNLYPGTVYQNEKPSWTSRTLSVSRTQSNKNSLKP